MWNFIFQMHFSIAQYVSWSWLCSAAHKNFDKPNNMILAHSRSVNKKMHDSELSNSVAYGKYLWKLVESGIYVVIFFPEYRNTFRVALSQKWIHP